MGVNGGILLSFTLLFMLRVSKKVASTVRKVVKPLALLYVKVY